MSFSIIGPRDQRDAALGAAEALGVEIRILADDEPVGNATPRVDDHFAETHVSPDAHVGKDDRFVNARIGMDAARR